VRHLQHLGVVLCQSHKALLPSALLLDISDPLFYSILYEYSNKLGEIHDPGYMLQFLGKTLIAESHHENRYCSVSQSLLSLLLI